MPPAIEGKAWTQEGELHRRAMVGGAWLSFSVLFSPYRPILGRASLIPRVGLAASIRRLRIHAHRHTPRCVSELILNLVKVTVKINLHNRQFLDAECFFEVAQMERNY